jgi:hypothetical protein
MILFYNTIIPQAGQILGKLMIIPWEEHWHDDDDDSVIYNILHMIHCWRALLYTI